MANLPLPAWAPDAAGIDDAAAEYTNNVFPRVKGWRPVPSLTVVSQALPGPCKGAVAVAGIGGSPVYFAGTQTDLYRLNSLTLAWEKVSGPSRYFVPDDDVWTFAQFGAQLVACHVNAPPQVINFASGAAFADLKGSGDANPPRARFVNVVADFLVLGGLPDTPDRIAWSALNDITGWDAGVDGSDIQQFPSGGEVVAVIDGTVGLVFQRSCIRRMTFTGNILNPFQFDVAEEERGAVSRSSVVKQGARVFFLDDDGFYLFADGASTPLSAEICSEWLLGDGASKPGRVDPARLGSVVGTIDPTGSRVIWAYRSRTGTTGVLDAAICYDWLLQRWAPFDGNPARFWLRALSLPKSLDAFTDPENELAISFDDASLAGGAKRLAAITTDNRLAFMNGRPLPASVETGDAMLGRPNAVFVRGLRPATDAAAFTVAIGGKNDLAAPTKWFPKAPRDTRTGFAPARCTARYHRARVDIPALTPWTYITGVEPDASKAGWRS